MAGSAGEAGGVLIYRSCNARREEGGAGGASLRGCQVDGGWPTSRVGERQRDAHVVNGDAIGYGRLEPNLRRAAGLLTRVAKRELAG
jgi:hypothetical protein